MLANESSNESYELQNDNNGANNVDTQQHI